jgi:hypothetical protein
MKTILQVRDNIYYTKETADGNEYTKIHELVILLDNPSYKRTNEGVIIRERGIEEVRFAITDKGIDNLIEILQSYKEAKEENLH